MVYVGIGLASVFIGLILGYKFYPRWNCNFCKHKILEEVVSHIREARIIKKYKRRKGEKK